jgi:hypothetical protein
MVRNATLSAKRWNGDSGQKQSGGPRDPRETQQWSKDVPLSYRDHVHAAGQQIPLAIHHDSVIERRTAAAINRAETRLKALTQAFEDQASRFRNELALEIKAIERGW